MKRVAVLKSKVLSAELASLLHTPQESTFIDEPIQDNQTDGLKRKLCALDEKLDIVIMSLTTGIVPAIGWSPDGLVFHNPEPIASEFCWCPDAAEFKPVMPEFRIFFY